jgi:hypothetical protein
MPDKEQYNEAVQLFDKAQPDNPEAPKVINNMVDACLPTGKQMTGGDGGLRWCGQGLFHGVRSTNP